MQIHSFSRFLSFPLIMMALGIIWYSVSISKSYSWLIFIPAVLLVVIYVFSGQIDFYYHKRFPLRFDEKLRDWSVRYFPHYNSLDEGQKQKFEYRLGLYMSGRAFKSVGSEQRDVPEDIKCMVAAHGIYMTLGMEDFLIGDVDRIFLYKHPFPTPDMPWLHNAEMNAEDGVIILSLEQLTNAILNPAQFYNTAFHVYAEALISVHRKSLEQLTRNGSLSVPVIIGPFSEEQILKHTGHKEINPLAVHIHYYFSFPDQYKTHFPDLYHKLSSVFNAR
jgi:Mlc titration factor MtfA (ptsG expression regulator)